MKIAFPSCSNSLDGALEQNIGKTPSFLIYDNNSHQIEILMNKPDLDSNTGKGIQSAKRLIEAGIDVLLGIHCGPKTFNTLKRGNIKVYTSNAKTSREILDQYSQGLLAPMDKANVAANFSSYGNCHHPK